MRLIKTLDLPGGAGQHFFFDMGGGNALAFFWFPDAPYPVPGISAPVTVLAGSGPARSGSMNHVAFNVPEERFGEYRMKRLGPVGHAGASCYIWLGQGGEKDIPFDDQRALDAVCTVWVKACVLAGEDH